MMEAQLDARIRHLKSGNQTIWNLNMVTYVKNLSDLITNVIKHGLGVIVKIVENFAKRHVTNAQITPLYARIQHLKFGNQTIWNLNMVTYVKNLSDPITNVIKHGLGAIVKIVENFAKRHVTNAQITPLYARIQHLKFGNQTIWNLNMVTYVKNLSDLITN